VIERENLGPCKILVREKCSAWDSAGGYSCDAAAGCRSFLKYDVWNNETLVSDQDFNFRCNVRTIP